MKRSNSFEIIKEAKKQRIWVQIEHETETETIQVKCQKCGNEGQNHCLQCDGIFCDKSDYHVDHRRMCFLGECLGAYCSGCDISFCSIECYDTHGEECELFQELCDRCHREEKERDCDECDWEFCNYCFQKCSILCEDCNVLYCSEGCLEDHTCEFDNTTDEESTDKEESDETDGENSNNE